MQQQLEAVKPLSEHGACQGYVLTSFHCRKLPCVGRHGMGKIMSHMDHRLLLVTWDVSILYSFSQKSDGEECHCWVHNLFTDLWNLRVYPWEWRSVEQCLLPVLIEWLPSLQCCCTSPPPTPFLCHHSCFSSLFTIYLLAICCLGCIFPYVINIYFFYLYLKKNHHHNLYVTVFSVIKLNLHHKK